MMSAAELNSENASAPRNVSGHERVSEAPAAGPTEPEAVPLNAAGAGETPAEPGGLREGPQPEAAPLAEAATRASAESSDRGDQAPGASPVAIEAANAAPENRLGAALAALDRRDYATARRLFEAVGRKEAAEAIDKALAALDRKDYATAQGLFEALAASRPAAPVEPPPDVLVDKAEEKPASSPLPVVPFVAPELREPSPPAKKPKPRRSRLLALAAGLALLAIFVAAWFGGTRRIASVAGATNPGTGALASAFNFIRSPLVTISGAGAASDLQAKLEQANDRLDRVEREIGARLDKLSQRMDENSDSKPAQPAAAPSAPVPDMADVAARLDRLEQNAATPVSELADVTARLDKLEKKITADPAASAKLAEVTTRLDKLEKRVSAQTANVARLSLPPRPGGARQSAPNDVASLADSRRILRDYAIEDVQDGVAVVAGRYGSQQVAPGDYIPGAGRVLRIERRRGDWYVLTSNGVIASAPAPY
jgi:tetrahydromethanopterin S-methyltransferase subunit G